MYDIILILPDAVQYVLESGVTFDYCSGFKQFLLDRNSLTQVVCLLKN